MTVDTDRLLPPAPVTTLEEHLDAGGGRGLQRARELGTDAICDLV